MKNLIVVWPDIRSSMNALSVRGRALINSLVSEGWSVALFSSRVDGATGSFLTASYFESSISLPPNNISYGKRVLQELLLGLSLACHVVRRKERVVLVTYPPFIVGLLCSFAVIISGKKLVLDVRDLYPEVYFRAGIVKETGAIGKVLSWLVNRLYMQASSVVTVTEGLASFIRSKYGVADVPVIMNGYGEEFQPGDSELPGEVVVVSHGNFGQLFDLTSFVDIARRLPSLVSLPYRIRLIGFGRKIDEVAAMGLPNVYVEPPVTNDEISSILKKCHIGLSLHSDYDGRGSGFPVKVLEYIGAGLPCVVMPVNEGGGMVSSRGVGLSFNEGDSEAAALGLARLIDNKHYRDSLRLRLISTREEFSLATQMARLSLILGKVS